MRGTVSKTHDAKHFTQRNAAETQARGETEREEEEEERHKVKKV